MPFKMFRSISNQASVIEDNYVKMNSVLSVRKSLLIIFRAGFVNLYYFKLEFIHYDRKAEAHVRAPHLRYGRG